MPRSLLLLFFCVLNTIAVHATHLVGGDISLLHLDSNRYLLKVKLYRDCYPSGNAALPDFAPVYLHEKGTATRIETFSIARDSIFVLTYKDVECLPDELDCRQIGVYIDTVTLDSSVFNNPTGYYLYFGDCCRNNNIVNILDPGGTGMQQYVEIPSPKMVPGNSTPEFRRPVLSFLCLGKPFSYDFKTVDKDGDSLVFSLATPLNQGTNGRPDNPIKWNTGYGLSYNIMDGSPDLKVDRKTGIVTVFPVRLGVYVFAVKCEEYRNGVKIGEARLENQFEVVNCFDAPPVTTVDDASGNPSLYIRAEELSCFPVLVAKEKDSIFLKVELTDSTDVNIFNLGATFTAATLKGTDSISGTLCWEPACADIRAKPYGVKFISWDNSCPEPYWDTLLVDIYVIPPLNDKPVFTAPDTNTLVYNIFATDLFKFDLDVIDSNASQVVRMEASSEVFGPSIALPFATFISDTGIAESHGTFSWQTTCDHIRPHPYIVRFFAIDNACPGGDTTSWKIRIFVRKPPNNGPLFSSPDTLKLDTNIIAGQLLNLPILISDSTDRFHNIRIEAVSELFDTTLALPRPVFSAMSGDSTISTLFSWQTDCAHVRDTPYELTLYTFDNACQEPDTTFYTLRIKVNYPPNTAPSFVSSFVPNQTIIAGTCFQLDLAVQDSNLSDSVFILLDSEVLDGSFPPSVPVFTTKPGLDTANATFYWEPGCIHIRPEPYKLTFYTFDNACKEDTTVYELNLTVLPRPNAAPRFTNPSPSITVAEGDIINLLLPAADSQHPDSVFIHAISSDLFGGTLPGNLPVFKGDSGISTANGSFFWETDCSHGRPEPYEILFMAWDNACPKRDTSFYTLQIYVTPDPKYSAKFLESPPLTDTLFADEKLNFEVTAGTDNNEENVTIEASSEVFTSIPPSYATFAQTGSIGTVTGDFDWQPGCQHVRSAPYTIKFKVYSDCPGSDTSYFETKILVKSHDNEVNELPNTFTPNGDGKNDTYTLKNVLKIYCDDSFYFQVFNRWGKKLFESADPNFEWTAEDTPAGTYYYILESNLVKKNGTITLLR